MPLARRLAIPLAAAWFSVLMSPATAQSLRSPQESPCVVEDIDTTTLPACVIQARNDALFIPKKYWMHPTFNRYGLSPFTIQSFGHVYINHTGRIVIRDVATIDNGPDDFHHGLVRINHDQMWGYADPSGRIVVPVKYSCALNYKDKYQDYGPLVCSGCRLEKQGEYTSCLGGQWFQVDIHGHLEPAPSPVPESKTPSSSQRISDASSPNLKLFPGKRRVKAELDELESPFQKTTARPTTDPPSAPNTVNRQFPASE